MIGSMLGARRRATVGALRGLRGLLSVAVPLAGVAAAPAAAEAQGARGTSLAVRGTVFDTLGAPLRGATVALMPGTLEATTDERGAFVLQKVRPGPYVIRVRALGHAPQTHPVTLDDSTAEQAFALVPTGPVLASVLVTDTAPSTPIATGFASRLNSRLYPRSAFVTREQIEKMQPLRFGDVLARVPGIRLERLDRTGATWPKSHSRGATSLEKECQAMHVYVDGTPVALESRRGIDHIDWRQVQGVEIYPGSARIPAEYNRTGAACGVILIWKR